MRHRVPGSLVRRVGGGWKPRLLGPEEEGAWRLRSLVLGKRQFLLTCCFGRSRPGSQHTDKV